MTNAEQKTDFLAMVGESVSPRAAGLKNRRNYGPLEQFLRGSFLRGQLERLELRHRTSNGNPVVRDWVLEDIDPSERSPDFLAEQILDSAQNDANALKGLSSYGVLAYRKGNDDASARHLFGIYGDGGPMQSGDVLGETEPPNAVGLVSQAQRFAEGSVRLLLSGYSQVMQYQQATIKVFAEQNQKMAEREERVMALQEELMNASHERKLESMREEKGENRKDRMLDKLELLVPAVLSKVVKDPDARTKLAFDAIKSTLAGLSPEQMVKLGEILTPEQQVAVGTAYQAFAEQADEKQAKKEGKP